MKLSESDRARIHSAISDAEAKTSARFAAAVLPASDRYGLYPLVWGAVVALTMGAILALLRPDMSLRHGMLIEFAAFAVFALAFDWLPLRLALVPKSVKHDHAHNFAHREFAARILAAGDHKDGVLLFVSLGERSVEILATRDVHAKVGAAAWDAIVADFVAAAKDGRIADGTVAAVKACADHLAAHFPKGA